MKKKIAIIGTVGVPAKYGGFETLAEYLVKNLDKKYELTVYCTSKAYPEKNKSYLNSQLVYIPLKANGIASIIYDWVSIFHALFYANTLLVLGVSGSYAFPFIRLFTKKKIVVNIDGLEWKREKWNKYTKYFLKNLERVAVKFANTIITDNLEIQKYVKEEYRKESNMIAYGGNHANPISLSEKTLKNYPSVGDNYAFSVCRIEPENNIHIILEAFALNKTYSLVFVGNWQVNNYSKKLKSEFSNYPNIHLIDPIYDQNELNELRSNCTFYVHGHSAGGTNPSLVEAMSLGLPVVAWGVNYNKATTNSEATYFNSANELNEIIKNINNIDLKAKAKKMLELANKNYTWEKIADQYAQLF